MEYYSATKRCNHAICSNMDGPEIKLSEVGQKDEEKYYMISLLYKI